MNLPQYEVSDENHRPAFLVLKVRAKINPHTRPLLVILNNGEIAFPQEPAQWIRYILQYDDYASAKAMLSTIGRLYQYASVAFAGIELTAETLPLVVYNYLAFRVGDRTADDPDAQRLPTWNPIRRATALAEFNTIVSYLRFCNDHYPTLPLLARPERLANFSDFDVRTTSKRDFLLHLSASRERWRGLLGIASYRAPRIRATASLIPRRSSKGQTVSRDEVDLIIDSEQNLVFKTLWILLAYTGIRISEALNAWCVDILPGTMIRHFEPRLMQAEPLVLLPDPIESRYVGDLRDTSTRRIEFLSKQFGLIPRPHYDKTDTRRAGWKSMLTQNEPLSLSWAYWLYPEPAEAFLHLTARLLNARKGFRSADHHPYLFVNIANAAHGGEPVKYGNVQKAFERACARVHLEPHIAGRSVHGLRRFYENVLENQFGLPPELIQVMMHHKSIMSQEAYKRTAPARVHEALTNARASTRSV